MDFLNGLFLAGAATALVPIVIHLVQRRRVQQVVFGSLRLLRKTPHRLIRRRRFEEILLVLLRALVLVILAAAFARPFFDRPQKQRVSGKALVGEEAVLMLIDNSYSMRVDGRLDRAKAKALEFLREVNPATKVGVAAYSSRLDELCPIGSKVARAEQAIRGIKQSWRGTRLAPALKQADRILTRADRREAYRRIALIGDFQASSWEHRGDWKLTPGVELSCHDVGASAPASPGRAIAAAKSNVFVERVAVPRLVVAGGFVEVISANIRNLTDQPLIDALVTFRVDGKKKATRTVNVRPGAEVSVRFPHKFVQPGDVTGSIAVDAHDDLPEDNVAHFCVHAMPRVHVLLVNADRSEEMALNDGLFLKTAMAPDANGVVSPFEVREVAPEQMKPADLDGVDVVLLLNVSRLPAPMTRIPPDKTGESDAPFHSPLGRFLADGGGVGFVCGSKVAPDAFNRTFDGLAPCKLSRLARQASDAPLVINQLDLRHEIFTEFARPHSGDFSLAEFRQYFLVTDSLGARVPARFSNADAHPALLERVFDSPGLEAGEAVPPADPNAPAKVRKPAEPAIGRPKGKSILFVSSMDLQWNNLCLKSVFVPFVHQLTKRLCARRMGSVRNFVVGDDVNYHVPKRAKGIKLRRQVGPPDKAEWGKPVALEAHAVGPASVVSFCPEEPGTYELTYEGAAAGQASRARFAVCLDAREPDLRPLDARLLRTTVQKGPALEDKPVVGSVSVATKASARERMESRQKVWRVLLFVVLAALAIEMLLAGRIGRA